MFNWRMKATNAIYLQDSDGQEGRPFKARFLQAGLVKYNFGVCLLKKETIDGFINTFIGTPVIIDHKDDISESDKVGVINNIWFSPEDGWFWCDGVITDESAIELIEKGYNVSCQYRITDYSENKEGKLHNGNPYDKEILNGVFEHLAIVENPRYEDAFIAVNAYIACNEDNKDVEWITVKGAHIPIKDGQSREEAIQQHWDRKKNEDKENAIFALKQIGAYEEDAKRFIEKHNIKSREELLKLAGGETSKILTDYYLKNYVDYNITSDYSDYNSFENDYKEYITSEPKKYDITNIETTLKDLGITKNKPKVVKTPLDEEKISYDTIEHLYTREDKTRPASINKMIKTLEDPLIINLIAGKKYYFKIFSSNDKSKKDIVIVSPDDEVLTNIPVDRAGWFFKMLKLGQTIYDVKNKRRKSGDSATHVNNIITHNQTNFNPNATNSIDTKYKAVLDYIQTTKGEPMDQETKGVFESLINALKARNEAEDEDTKKEKKDDKASNEEVDKRDIIRQIMAIAGKHEDNEDVRTIAKLAEKLAYDKSEAGTADNGKAKNEDEEEDKKDEAKNKCKNEDEDDKDYKKLYEELKERVEKEAENKKAKNSLDALKKVFYEGEDYKAKKLYMTQKEGIELGRQLY